MSSTTLANTLPDIAEAFHEENKKVEQPRTSDIPAVVCAYERVSTTTSDASEVLP